MMGLPVLAEEVRCVVHKVHKVKVVTCRAKKIMPCEVSPSERRVESEHQQLLPFTTRCIEEAVVSHAE